MTPLRAHIEGVSLWAPFMPGWAVAGEVLSGRLAPVQPPCPIPPPARLPPAERRRAPQTVALALAAAEEAVAASGRDPGSLLAVFASTHGDLPVIDDLCRTLVHTPTLVSPTRFLHSIHNAPAGFWSQLNRNGHAHTAVSGAACSFAQGLLEALVQCEAEQQPVLYVAYDTAAVGALTHTTASESALAVALVLAPHGDGHPNASLTATVTSQPVPPPEPQCAQPLPLQRNAMAAALPLFEWLARGEAAEGAWPLGTHQSLSLRYRP
ncbi:beta-ketoacyl synthase chain length factor [Hydrogenophaga sp.]|uniref:beta-ketoacyl synthase chain length factor n=1 Tax=Hydrogenophaga sp. TaxID=1904254 RepID=UPI0035B43805